MQLPDSSHPTEVINPFRLGGCFAAIVAAGPGWMYFGSRPQADFDEDIDITSSRDAFIVLVMTNSSLRAESPGRRAMPVSRILHACQLRLSHGHHFPSMGA